MDSGCGYFSSASKEGVRCGVGSEVYYCISPAVTVLFCFTATDVLCLVHSVTHGTCLLCSVKGRTAAPGGISHVRRL